MVPDRRQGGQQMAKEYVLAIDQGTTSTRAMLFRHNGTVAGVSQEEHEQIYPRAGWVEHDPKEIWDRTKQVTASVLADANLTWENIAAVGITNQRETTVVWDRNTGEPVYNAIVWQDTRTQPIVSQWKSEGYEDEIKRKTGLVIATYFSGTKIAWILENVEGARERAEAGDLLFGNTDTWVIWNLTGGVNGGQHITDYTNASDDAVPAAEHRQHPDPVQVGPADHRVLRAGARQQLLRAGGLDRHHRRGRAVAARQPEDDRQCGRDRGDRQVRRGLGRRVLRPGLLRTLRPVLGREGPRRDRGADPLRQPRAPGQGHPGVDVLPEP